ncbi:MAG: type II toxin-antitoxin system Phd/YefM family antitoxin [Immundisolibacter sp.]|jgi:prevent-host-death family protein|uniref:type II toxin-antitoxin system Phd/YefM family antitoxin n=1 Tax=Immundisolibacter sp. TaxID=1934948 RepID=UPI003566B2AD
MTVTVNIHQAKTQLSKLLAQAQAGEEVIIAKSGKPWAKLVPIRSDTARRPGIATGAVTDAFFEPLPEEELDAWS